eukprot:TRINITY_DN7596_c0_g1_i1.p1 TRINITY_DN7596_c0_g1~~TRINITY_DN7596_c0_g1_i1.p1  ORF type:complete len:247 (+),score=23.25 TRINITY_DN7596_c0_g1_i1:47-787(+)
MAVLSYFAICLVLAFVGVESHNWVLTPPSRNGNTAFNAGSPASSPCDPGAVRSGETRYLGDPIAITWTAQHPTGNHLIYLVPLAQESTLESLTTPLETQPPLVAASTSAIPGNLAPGKYVAQYRWDTYRNCVDLVILARPPPNAVSANDPTNSYLYTIPNGIFDASTGSTSCSSGYTRASDGSCTSDGGRVFGILLLVALILTVVGFVGYFGYLKATNPQKYAKQSKALINKVTCSKGDDSYSGTP